MVQESAYARWKAAKEQGAPEANGSAYERWKASQGVSEEPEEEGPAAFGAWQVATRPIDSAKQLAGGAMDVIGGGLVQAEEIKDKIKERFPWTKKLDWPAEALASLVGAEEGVLKESGEGLMDASPDPDPSLGGAGKVVRGMGSGVGFMTGGAALGGGKAAVGIIGVLATGYFEGEAARQRALRAGASEEEADEAYWEKSVHPWTIASGVSEMFPFAGILARVNRRSGGALKRSIGGAVRKVAEEGAEGLAQGSFQEIVSIIHENTDAGEVQTLRELVAAHKARIAQAGLMEALAVGPLSLIASAVGRPLDGGADTTRTGAEPQAPAEPLAPGEVRADAPLVEGGLASVPVTEPEGGTISDLSAPLIVESSEPEGAVSTPEDKPAKVGQVETGAVSGTPEIQVSEIQEPEAAPPTQPPPTRTDAGAGGEPGVQAGPPADRPAEAPPEAAQEAPGSTQAQEAPEHRPGNPFAEKALRARRKADQLSGQTAHEKGMAESFPLGPGFGRGNLDKKANAGINRAVKAVEATKEAERLEALSRAYDEGRVNAQGRNIDAAAVARSEKAAKQRQSREERIEAAKREIEGKEAWEVPGDVWATAHGYLGGSGRKLVLSDHAEAVAKARAEGKVIPSEAPEPVSAPDARESAPEAPGDATSIKNAVVDRELAELGRPPAEHGERVSFGMAAASAERAFAEDPYVGQKLLDELEGSGRPPTGPEVAILLRERNRLRVARRQAQDELFQAREAGDADLVALKEAQVEGLVERYARASDVTTRAGTVSAQGLALRQMMMREDFSLAEMERAARVANSKGAVPDAQVQADIQALNEKIERLEAAFQEHIAAREARREERTAKQRARKRRSPALRALSEQAEAARARQRERGPRVYAGIDLAELADEVVIGADYLARGVEKFAEWSAEMVREFGEAIRPKLRAIYNEAKRVAKEVNSPVLPGTPQFRRWFGKSVVTETGEPGGKPSLAYKAMPAADLEGKPITEVNRRSEFPAFNRDEPGIALAGWFAESPETADRFTHMTKPPAPIMQVYLKLERPYIDETGRKAGDIQFGESGRAFREAMRSGQYDGAILRNTSDEGTIYAVKAPTQVKSATGNSGVYDPANPDIRDPIPAGGSRLLRVLSEQAAAARQRQQERGPRLYAGIDTAELVDEIIIGADAIARGISDFAAWSAEMVKTFGAGIQKHLEALYALSQDKLADAEVEAVIARLQANIERLTQRIESGDIAPRKGKALPDHPEVKRLEEQRTNLRRELARLQAAAKPPEAKSASALKAYKTRKRNELERISDKLDREDFSPPPPRKPLSLDEEALALQAQVERAKKDFQAKLREYRRKNRTRGQVVKDTAKDVLLEAPRGIITSGDFPPVFRQAAWSFLTHPFLSVQQLPPAFRAAFSEKRADVEGERIKAHPDFALAQRAELRYSDPDGEPDAGEEYFRSVILKEAPYLKDLVGFSERGFTTFLNSLRMEMFSRIVRSKLDGKPTKEQAEDVAGYVNAATGRGAGELAKKAQKIRWLLWSPQLNLSQFQLLTGPLTGFHWKGSVRARDARVRKILVQEYARALGGAAAMVALGLAAGADIEKDPRSSDFGKIRFGNTRLNPFGGLIQMTVALARPITGSVRTLSTDDLRDYSDGDIGRLLRYKLAPALGNSINLITGENAIGEPVNVTTKEGLKNLAGSTVIPLSWQDISEAMQEQGVPAGAVMGALTLFGMGLQTFYVGDAGEFDQHARWIRDDKDGLGKFKSRLESAERQIAAKEKKLEAAKTDKLKAKLEAEINTIQARLNKAVEKALDE